MTLLGVGRKNRRHGVRRRISTATIAETFYLLLESGDSILLESGDHLLLEAA